jgi:hypothetical protein
MRENRTSGSVRGALGNRRSYREIVTPRVAVKGVIISIVGIISHRDVMFDGIFYCTLVDVDSVSTIIKYEVPSMKSRPTMVETKSGAEAPQFLKRKG